MAAKRKDIDREGLEIAYRAGVKSLRLLSKEFGLAASRITQIANEEGWERDLAAKIREKAAAKLNASLLNIDTERKQNKPAEKEVIEANAQAIVHIQLAHRRDIQRTRSLAMSLLSELEATTDNAKLFQELGEMLRSEDKQGNDRRNDLYSKVISLSGRVMNMKQLSDTLKTLVGLERQAFGMNDDGGSGTDEYESMLKKLYGNG
ncbi:MAG: hypothetical protein ABIT70_10925 [Sulfuriferula sp.]